MEFNAVGGFKFDRLKFKSNIKRRTSQNSIGKIDHAALKEKQVQKNTGIDNQGNQNQQPVRITTVNSEQGYPAAKVFYKFLLAYPSNAERRILSIASSGSSVPYTAPPATNRSAPASETNSAVAGLMPPSTPIT